MKTPRKPPSQIVLKHVGTQIFLPLGMLAAVGIMAVFGFQVRQYFFAKAGEACDADCRRERHEIAKDDIETLLAAVGTLTTLPEGEEPTVLTVRDPSALRTQPFFDGAKEGDRVLIYTQAGKAILYDPVKKEVVRMAAVDLGGD